MQKILFRSCIVIFYAFKLCRGKKNHNNNNNDNKHRGSCCYLYVNNPPSFQRVDFQLMSHIRSSVLVVSLRCGVDEKFQH